MVERIRDIQVTVEVDTNKRTVRQTFSGDSLTEALAAAAEYFEGRFE